MKADQAPILVVDDDASQSHLASQNLMDEALAACKQLETVNRELEQQVSIRKTHEREIERLSRLYATLSQVNQAIVRTGSREELLGSVCRIVTECGGYKLAWIGRLDPQTQLVMPFVRAGEAAAYVDEVKLAVDERPEGQGPAGIVFRENRPIVFNDFFSASAGQPWHVAAQAHGLRAVAVFPIHFQGRIWGGMAVYDGEVDAFQDREIALLVEAAMDISFALEHLEREAQRQRAEAALHLALAEKTTLVKEIHHRVKNNLAIMVSLINMQMRRIKHPEALAALQDTQARLSSMSMLHEMMYCSGRMDRVEVKGYLESLCGYLVQSFGMSSQRVQIRSHLTAALMMGIDQAVPCGLIVSELVSNAIKHAFPEARQGEILVELILEAPDSITLRVIDNGIGLPDALKLDEVQSVGLSLVNALVRQLGGTLDIRREAGTLFEIHFPLLPTTQ